MNAYFAHSLKESADTSRWQLLREHLTRVADLSRQFARDARPGDEVLWTGAAVMGLLHDLGKYRPEFQQMIRGLRAKGEATRHKQAGAARAALQGRPDLAFAIAGHHGGLPDAPAYKDLLSGPGGRDVAEQVWHTALGDCPDLDRPLPPWGRGISPLQFDLQVRLLFSCLVDADWLDTSEFHRRAAGLPPPPPPAALEPGRRLESVREFIRRRASDPSLDPGIAAIRAQVLDAALRAADAAPGTGLFSMTVPTGGGKTLSALAFALSHAARIGLSRVIYVAPYLSIIEQNAAVIRAALGAAYETGVVLEHHSLAEPRAADGGAEAGADPNGGAQTDEEASDADRLAENWAAPVVLTTSVQFYESLFASRPGRCRKVHNVARSIVILDECQTLPPGLIAPTARMLESFCEFAGCSIVLCTATQPAWNRDEKRLPEGLGRVQEVVPADLRLFDRLRRVRVAWPKGDERWDWATVASRMLEKNQALCVVNSKAAARTLFEALRASGAERPLHLSTLMCPAHRIEVLDRIRKLLKEGQPCHLVSTQLIEAGVDVDFPLLLREIAPLESVVQAAGRCNREGLLNRTDAAGAVVPGGEVIVFRSIDGKGPRDNWYRNGIRTIEQDFLGVGREPDLSSPADLADYFRRLYPMGNLDARGINPLQGNLHFATVADEYQLIDDATTSVVVAKWKPAEQRVADLLAKLRQQPTRETYRALGRYQVNLFDQDRRELGATILEGDAPGLEVCIANYDADLGLVGGFNPTGLIF